MNTTPDLIVTKTYTITLGHEAKLSDLADRTGRKKSDLLREAIDQLYQSYAAAEAETQPES